MPLPAAFVASDAEWAAVCEADVPVIPDADVCAGACAGPSAAPLSCNIEKVTWLGEGEPIPGWVQRPTGTECEITWVTMWCDTCDERRDVKRHPSRCHKPTCPSCHDLWTAEEADKILHRLWWGKRHVPGRIWECIVSPPRGAVAPTPAAVESLLARSYRLAEAHGMSGGEAQVHYEMRESPGEWRPHVQILGYVDGSWTPGPTSERGAIDADGRWTHDVYSQGWLIKFVRVGDSKKALRSKAAYEVGHAVRQPGHHAVRWWGTASYAAWKSPTKAEVETVMGFEPRPSGPVCPVCGRPLRELDWYDLEVVAQKGHPPRLGGRVGVG